MRRRAALAGAWYPADPAQLRAMVDSYLSDAASQPRVVPAASDLLALIVPHAGLMYSGAVAACAYHALAGRRFDTIVLAGPSHFVPFEGVAVWARGAFASPLGDLAIDEEVAAAVLAASPRIVERPEAHAREHSLEMQLPFLAHLAPQSRLVPLVMGEQTRATVRLLAEVLAVALEHRSALLIASSDLSHFHDAITAAALDARVVDCVEAFDHPRLMTLLEERPEHACGGGPMVSVLAATAARGAAHSAVLRYADSGDVSGDKTSVVGYMAAAVWR